MGNIRTISSEPEVKEETSPLTLTSEEEVKANDEGETAENTRENETCEEIKDETSKGETSKGETSKSEIHENEEVKEGEAEEENETSDDEEGDEVPNKEEKLFTSSLLKNAFVYVVSIDGEPRCYVKDEKTALSTIREIAGRLQNSQTNPWCGFEYNTNSSIFSHIRIVSKSHDEIHVTSTYNFLIVSYDRVLYRLTYKKIHEIAT